jgi:molybdopterin-guanine dinucleotide biosynthesis protein A
MGRDKALLDFNGSPLIQLALDCARSVADSTIIIGPQDKFSTYAPSIQDIYPDRGPLGGIYSALASTTTELNLILAIDTPLIAPTFLANLRILAENNPSHAIVPRINRRLQPLCAIYRTSCADPAHQLLAANINKVEALIQSVPHHILDTDELLRLGATTEMFLNLNTPEDYQAALQSLKRP